MPAGSVTVSVVPAGISTSKSGIFEEVAMITLGLPGGVGIMASRSMAGKEITCEILVAWPV